MSQGLCWDNGSLKCTIRPIGQEAFLSFGLLLCESIGWKGLKNSSRERVHLAQVGKAKHRITWLDVLMDAGFDFPDLAKIIDSYVLVPLLPSQKPSSVSRYAMQPGTGSDYISLESVLRFAVGIVPRS